MEGLMTIPAIIGVLGRTISTRTSRTVEAVASLPLADQQLLHDARVVGEIVGGMGLVLLTGGSYHRSELSVKHEVILGAVEGARRNPPARLIGILPDTISEALGIGNRPAVENGPTGAVVQFVDLHTGWPSEYRDQITGRAGDAYIALHGVSGTPREVVAALNAGRPVVFLRSWESLEKAIVAELDLQKLSRTLLPASPLEALDAEGAVKEALNAIGWGGPHPKLAGTIRDQSKDFGLPEELVAGLDMKKMEIAMRRLMA
jgi:predicted Rossmann-fold nucleotide-binding protein